MEPNVGFVEELCYWNSCTSMIDLNESSDYDHLARLNTQGSKMQFSLKVFVGLCV